MKNDMHRIAIIGAGKVGTAVGNILAGQGHRLVAATAATKASLKKASPFLPGARLTLDSAQAIAEADVVLITTKDEQIKAVCDGLAAQSAFNQSHTVIHMSGAGSLNLLDSAKVAGAKIASIHPIQSFASVELAIEKLPGSYFGVTAEGEAKDTALSIVRDLDGKPVEISDENKSLYHAAACITSNYLVTLLHLAKKVYAASGLDEEAALEAMMPLIKGTVANIESVGTVAALTGPIARGDVKVIEQHLASLARLSGDANDTDATIVDVYKALGLQTVDVALQKGTLSVEAAKRLSAALKMKVDVE